MPRFIAVMRGLIDGLCDKSVVARLVHVFKRIVILKFLVNLLRNCMVHLPGAPNLKTYARTRGVQTLINDLISGGKLRNTVRRLLRDLKTTVRPDTTTRNKFRVYAIEVPLRGTSKRPADRQSPFTFRDFAWNVKGRIKPER